MLFSKSVFCPTPVVHVEIDLAWALHSVK